MTHNHLAWALLPTPEIEQYLRKYQATSAPGKCSSRRRKKIQFFKQILVKREKALRLITQSSKE